MRSQPTCGLFLGLGEIPNKQDEVFVYTKTLLAKDFERNFRFELTQKIN